jgi:hypothetical protein
VCRAHIAVETWIRHGATVRKRTPPTISPSRRRDVMDRMFEVVAGLALVATWVLVALQAQAGI